MCEAIRVPLTKGRDADLFCRVLSDRYSYAVAMSTLGAFNLAAALVFLACPGASQEGRAALQEAEGFCREGGGAELPKARSCQDGCPPATLVP